MHQVPEEDLAVIRNASQSGVLVLSIVLTPRMPSYAIDGVVVALQLCYCYPWASHVQDSDVGAVCMDDGEGVGVVGIEGHPEQWRTTSSPGTRGGRRLEEDGRMVEVAKVEGTN